MSDPGFNCGRFDAVDFVKEQAEIHRELLSQGIRVGEERFYSAIRSVDVAYRKALLDPETKIPSYMAATLYALINMLPHEETVEAKVTELLQKAKSA